MSAFEAKEFRQHLETICSADPETAYGCLKTVNTLIQNVMKHLEDTPEHEKFKKVNLTNKRIASEVCGVSGGEAALRSFGFQSVDETPSKLVLSKNVTHEHMNTCWQEIGRCVENMDEIMKKLAEQKGSQSSTVDKGSEVTSGTSNVASSSEYPSNPTPTSSNPPRTAVEDHEDEQMKRALEMSMESANADNGATSQKRPRGDATNSVPADDDPDLAAAIALSLNQGTANDPITLDGSSQAARPQSEFAKSATAVATSTDTADDVELQKALEASLLSTSNDKPDDDTELQKAIQASLGPQEDMNKVLMMSALDEIHRMQEREKDPRQRQRAEGMCAGLRNIGNTCYVNSLLQTYFLLPPFRNTILGVNANEAGEPEFAEHALVDDELKQALALSMEGAECSSNDENSLEAAPMDEEKRRAAVNCLWQLQCIFALLCRGTRSYVDPSDALHALFKPELQGKGSSLEIGVQEDITEFNDMFLDCVEVGLRACSCSNRTFIDEMFFGKLEVEVVAEEADGTETKEDPPMEKFSHIMLPIHSGDLSKALEETFGQWEALESFTTSKGHTTTKARKRLQCKVLPKVLIFPLQRIQFDRELGEAVKQHDPFQFPEAVSLGWLLGGDSDGSSEYVLLSVLMHRGKANSGHYWSFVKDGARWLQFNDTEVSESTTESVLDIGRGSGAEASASCLVYVKKDLMSDAEQAAWSATPLPQALHQVVREDDTKLQNEIIKWDEREAEKSNCADLDSTDVEMSMAPGESGGVQAHSIAEPDCKMLIDPDHSSMGHTQAENTEK